MTITVDDFEVFCQRSFAGVLRVVDRLGDDLINVQPKATGGTSPFGLVSHILGACEYWVGHMVVGDDSSRARAEEFTATGAVAELHTSIEAWLKLLIERKAQIQAATELTSVPNMQVPLEGEFTIGAALIHAYEELVQHLGHLEVTADLIESEVR